ncbi:MAG: hypothetical protein F6K21_34795 [Symploca sp. SIO2D2]|nr:hypothetical protein [Symploca sp. SIO2D2]
MAEDRPTPKGERKKEWGAEGRRELGELRDKRELIAIGYKAQEIPPKISFTPPLTPPRREEYLGFAE